MSVFVHRRSLQFILILLVLLRVEFSYPATLRLESRTYQCRSLFSSIEPIEINESLSNADLARLAAYYKVNGDKLHILQLGRLSRLLRNRNASHEVDDIVLSFFENQKLNLDLEEMVLLVGDDEKKEIGYAVYDGTRNKIIEEFYRLNHERLSFEQALRLAKLSYTMFDSMLVQIMNDRKNSLSPTEAYKLVKTMLYNEYAQRTPALHAYFSVHQETLRTSEARDLALLAPTYKERGELLFTYVETATDRLRPIEVIMLAQSTVDDESRIKLVFAYCNAKRLQLHPEDVRGLARTLVRNSYEHELLASFGLTH